MNTHQIDPELVASVVAHMNEDHNDACLAIVRALGEQKTSIHAAMTSMDTLGADFIVTCNTGNKQDVRIYFDKPISRDTQIRGHLVALTKRARAVLKQG